MAKVLMPLMSAEASGSLANALVYFTWKGLNVVRQYTIPTNPRDINQQIIRQKLAAAGRNVAVMAPISATLPNGAKIIELLKAAAPAGQIWNAYFVSNILTNLANDNTFTTLSDALFNGTAAALTCWQTSATGLLLEDITGAAYATTISPELQLFMGGYGAFQLALSGTTFVYNDYPSNWTEGKIEAFALDYSTNT